MSSLNKVMLIGHLGKDPEIKSLNSGGTVANMSIATSERWKDKDGTRQEKTEWHRIVIWNEHLVKIVQQYLHKGDKVYLEGQLQTRKYAKDGKDHYATEVVLPRFGGAITMLSTKGTDGGQRDTSGDDHGAGEKQPTRNSAGLDDIPF